MTESLGIPEPDSIDVKRFHLLGVEIRDVCPKCKVPCSVDLGNHYLSYPKYNQSDKFRMCCPECESEWEVKFLLKLTLEIVP